MYHVFLRICFKHHAPKDPTPLNESTNNLPIWFQGIPDLPDWISSFDVGMPFVRTSSLKYSIFDYFLLNCVPWKNVYHFKYQLFKGRAWLLQPQISGEIESLVFGLEVPVGCLGL